MSLKGRATVFWTVLVLAFGAAPAAALDVLVAAGSVWAYLDDGSRLRTAWRKVPFDDTTWARGPAKLGYGDHDAVTVLGSGRNRRPRTTYFRRAFEVTAPGAYRSLTVRLLRDDGAVVYLNGVELLRSNLPTGPLTFETLASVPVSRLDERTFEEVTLTAEALVAGRNVLAVEVHQASRRSSDLGFDLELLGNTGAVRVVRGPYLQKGTPSSLVVRWRTDEASDSQVRYGPDPERLHVAVGDSTLTRRHAVELTGLSPETRYYYSVGTSESELAGGDATTLFHTPPPAGSRRPARIWVIGDSGTAGDEARAVRDGYRRLVGSAYTHLWLMLGDNAYYAGTDDEYQAAVFETYPVLLRQSVLYSAFGNHDGFSADSASQVGPYYEIFTFPTRGEVGGAASGTEAFYSFDYANVHFVALDSYESDRSPGGAMAKWLKRDLVAAKGADWLIAFWHHSPYARGRHDSDVEPWSREMRDTFLPILESRGVDLVLTGHSHAYGRSALLDGHYGLSGSFRRSMVLDAGSGRGAAAYVKPTPGLAPHEGTVYVVGGSSGKATDDVAGHPVTYFARQTSGSVVLDVDGLRLDFRFVDERGDVVDHFTIRKGDGSVAQ